MKRLSLILTVVCVGVTAGLYLALPEFQSWTREAYFAFSSGELENMRDFLNDYRQWGYLIILVAFLIQMLLFVLPSVVVMTLSILMYGPLVGVLLCIAGIGLASSIAYLIGDAVGDVTVEKIVGHKTQTRMTDLIESYGFWTVLVCRISPFLSNDAVSFVAGMVNMSFRRFIIATLLGITPLAVLLAWVGENTDELQTGLTVVSVIGLLALAVGVLADQKAHRRRLDEDE